MKDKSNTEEFTDSDWDKLASSLSEENGGDQELLDKFLSEDGHIVENQWKRLKTMTEDNKINVDKAWDNLYSRLNETGTFKKRDERGTIFVRSTFMRIAAGALLLVSIGSLVFYLATRDSFTREIVAATGSEQKNQKITLPDGSNVFLNRNTQLSYHSNFGKHDRKVILSGEAFFEISPDAAKPFIIDAGEASVEVIGTSFNVITRNIDSAVEVYVKTGRVMLSDNSGTREIILEPEDVGTMNSKYSGKSPNRDPNYLAWNTGLLVYDGQTLEIVFNDLKKVYNMDVVADDPEILYETWTSQIDNQTQDTIIRLICISFNLRYSKDGNVFHLSKK